MPAHAIPILNADSAEAVKSGVPFQSDTNG